MLIYFFLFIIQNKYFASSKIKWKCVATSQKNLYV